VIALIALLANVIISRRAKIMASLSVRRIDKAVYERLRVRAALHGVSMEEEIRQILVQTVTAPVRISEVFKKHFGSENSVDLTIAERKPHHPLGFEE
jgi:antitoxin FitA